MCPSPQSDRDHFRILLYQNHASEVLAEVTGRGLQLPALTIPRHSRVAEEVTAAIEDRWSLPSYCLFSLPRDPGANASTCYQVLEVCQSGAQSPAGMQWFPVGSLSAPQFPESADFAALQGSQLALDRYRRAELPGQFGKSGWLWDVKQWVAENSAVSGLSLTGKFRQFNASPTFSLLRFETDGPALWFKAVGEPNVREYAITLHLAHLLSGYVPRIIAANHQWNAWLSIEAEGQHLSDASSSAEWQDVANTLANLQIASFGNGLHLIDSGCRDVRAHLLLEQVDPFFDCMAELMENQAKLIPSPLTRSELTNLREAIRKALEELNQSEIPNVLGHLDCNPGNILVSQERCIFLDWAEGCVGHPFFTFEYLLEHSRRLCGPDASAEKAILSAYTTPWQSFASPRDIAASLQLTPLLAAFAYAASSQAWRNSDIVCRPETAAFFRSLTRRMKREADTLQQRRVTCVP
jgi:hypothetical protein